MMTIPPEIHYVSYAAHNFSLLRRLALNLLRQDRTARCGTKGSRLKAGCDSTYRLQVLNGSS
jgi:hypothetical protein